MNGTSLNTITLVGLSLVLAACDKGTTPNPDHSARPPATSHVSPDRPKTPASTSPSPTPAGPIAPVNPSDDIPPGPHYPPARANVVPEPQSLAPKSLLRKLERFFKDAAPAGENRSVHPKSVAEHEPSSNRGKFTADQLRPALRQNTAHVRFIGMILDKRSGNEVTKRLKTYLTAEDAKTAASAAENVIEEIFATDRKPEVKLYELAGDFDEIQRLGYYDEAIAGRRDFLQARLDQAWSSNKAWSSDLPTAIIVDVAPALLIGLAAGFRAPVLDTAMDVGKGTVRNVGRLAPLVREGGPVLSRNFRLVVTKVLDTPAVEAVEAKLVQIGIGGLPLTNDTVRNIEKLMVMKDGTKFKLNFVKTPHPDFQYAVTRYYNGVENAGEFIVFKYRPLGLTNKTAMTGELSPAQVKEIEAQIAASRGSVTKITKNGLETSELPLEAVRSVTPTGKPMNAPRAWRAEAEATADTAKAVDQAAAPTGPRAYRLDQDNPQVRIVEEAADAAPTKGAQAASREGSPWAESRGFDFKRATAGFIGGAALMAYPAKIYYDKGKADGEEHEILYLGGQYDQYVPPAPPTSSDKPQQTSEVKSR